MNNRRPSSGSPYRLRTAANGLQVLTVHRPDTAAVTVEFLFKAGSRYETPQTNGLAHFNEHMAFKGSERYPTFTEVNQAFDKVGAVNNAFTSSEVTGFYAKVLAQHTEAVLDVLSDMLTTAKYDAAELDRERGVIIEEINMYEDNPARQLPTVLEETLYPNHPLGRTTLGPKENIRAFTPDDFRAYAARHHTPERGMLILAGQVEDLSDATVDRYVARLTGTTDAAPEPAAWQQEAPALGVRTKQTEQTHLSLALRGPSMADVDQSIVLDVLSMVLGGGMMSSRLFTEVRERQGLAYYVHSVPLQYTDTGALAVFAGVTNDKAPQAVQAILRELVRFRDSDLSADELAMGKASLASRLALRWEDSSELADFYGEQHLLLGEVMSTGDLLARIESVTIDEVVGLAQELVQDKHLNFALIGPHDEEKFRNLLTFKQ